MISHCTFSWIFFWLYALQSVESCRQAGEAAGTMAIEQGQHSAPPAVTVQGSFGMQANQKEHHTSCRAFNRPHRFSSRSHSTELSVCSTTTKSNQLQRQ